MISISAAILCMSMVIHHEARGESLRTRYLVASVVSERAKTNGGICKEAASTGSYSGLRRHRILNHLDLRSWKETRILAEKIITGEVRVLAGRRYFNKYYMGTRYKTKFAPIYSGKMLFY